MAVALAEIPEGAKVHALYEADGQFYPAVVLHVSVAQKRRARPVKIKYSGYDEEAWVALGSLKSKKLGLPASEKSGATAKQNAAPDFSAFSKGMQLQVKARDGKFYLAEVVQVSKKVGAQTPLRVHYAGYTSASDEWVSADRIRSKALKPGSAAGMAKPAMPSGTRLVIAGDVGGTNARMQLLEVPAGAGKEPRVLHEKRYPPKDFANMEALIRRFVADAGASRPVEVCCLGFPNPVEDERRLSGPVLPNQPTTAWKTDAHDTVAALGGLVKRLVLLNDFVAIGYGLTALKAEDLETLLDRPRKKGMPIGCVGAGTGLGEVYLTWDKAASQYTSWSSEGGMADFNAHSDEEWRLRQWLRANWEVDTYGPGTGGVVTVEAVVSGPGLLNVYRWLVSEAPKDATPAVDLEGAPEDLPGLIAQKASSDALCLRAVEVMLTAYAAECRRKALELLPLGGMFIAGGIAPKLIEHIRRIFPREFLNDPVNKVMLDEVPLYVVMNDNVGLLGSRVKALQCLK